ncbi:hypothetical protein [Martelella sp. HB161492]|nr:hypothetical protein [Martelella sp. HB161492]
MVAKVASLVRDAAAGPFHISVSGGLILVVRCLRRLQENAR